MSTDAKPRTARTASINSAAAGAADSQELLPPSGGNGRSGEEVSHREVDAGLAGIKVGDGKKKGEPGP